MCKASCFDSWARLLALAEACGDEPRSSRLTRRGFIATAAMPMVAAACARPLPPPPGPTRDLLEATLSFEHVGIGTDMDGIGPGVIFTSYDRWPSLAEALLARGYGRAEVAKILGGNCQRVFQRVSGADGRPQVAGDAR